MPTPTKSNTWLVPGAHWLVALGVVVYFVTLFKCAWLSDDYFITLRQVEQVFAGNGIRFNLYERSFLSTSVIYFFVLLPLRVLTSDPFVLHAIVALTCNAALLWLLWVLARKDVRVWLLALGLLFASKAHFDYSWFGQENPIGHVLAAAIVLIWLRMYPDLRHGEPPDRFHWRWFVALIAVAPLYRHDFVMLAWPLAAWALWDNRARLGAKGLTRSIGWMLAPLFLWTLFSLIYFGFPLPASAYAKLPADAGFLGLVFRLESAWDYYRFSVHKDTVMMAVLLGSQLLWLGRGPARAIAAAMSLALLYVLFVGADYMGGRFFTVPYVLLVALLTGTSTHWSAHLRGRLEPGQWRWLRGVSITALVVWIGLWPHSPLTGPVVYAETVLDVATYPNEIANERAAWHPKTGITVWWRSVRAGTTYPDDVTVRLGSLLRDSKQATFHVCNLGMTPYRARLEQNFLDVWGLGDKFMANLPATAWRPGHYVRVRPTGLAESTASRSQAFVDAGLNRYFRSLRVVTGGERLLSTNRFKEIIRANLGLYDELLHGAWTLRESGVTPADRKLQSFLEQELGSVPTHSKGTDALPLLCQLIRDQRADGVLRQRIP